ncbi:50S ribosomal protein L28 [Candidatus Poribacteria bacterium]|nr:50S ribosomal protein L28 [Candidatus Poribacteria bacterium]
MARVCHVCGKKPMAGNKIARTRGQISKRSKHRQLPNLQRVRIQTESGSQRVRVCVRCLRTGKIIKSISGGAQVAYGN